MVDFLAYDIAHTVIVGILFLSGFFFCCLSFCFARMKHDPERRGIHFFKAAAVFFQFCCFFDIVTHIVDEVIYDSSDFFESIILVINELAVTANLFGLLTSIFVFLALIRIGVGILRASRPAHKLNDGKPAGIGARLPRFIGWAAYGWGGLVGVLTIAQFGLSIDYYLGVFTFYFYDLSDQISLANQYLASAKLQFAIAIMLFIAALLTLAWTIAVFILTRAKPNNGQSPRMMRPATYLLVCGVLFLIVRTYDLAEFAVTHDVTSTFTTSRAPIYLGITQAILEFAATYVILVLLMVLARIRDGSGGLWSTHAAVQAQAQQWTPGAPAPWQTGYVPPQQQQYQQPPMQQQQQQWTQAQQPLQQQQVAGQQQQHAIVAPTPPHSVSPPASTPPAEVARNNTGPPQIPTPDLSTATELPLTHPPTEWELPTNAPGSNVREAEAGSSAAPVAESSPKVAQ